MTRVEKQKRTRRRRKGGERGPINLLASLLTALGLYCGVASVFASIYGDHRKAALLILGALLFDMSDGTVAKLTHSVSEFGKEFDSLCDLVSFGIAPAVMVFTSYIHEETISADSPLSRFGSMMAVAFVLCGAIRLARFNVFQSNQREYFSGLPIPAAGVTIASLTLFIHFFKDQELDAYRVGYWVMGPMSLALACLMVSSIRYPKDRLKMFVMKPRSAMRLLPFCVIGIVAIHWAVTHSPWLLLFPMCAAYVLFGLEEHVRTRLLYRRSEQTEQEPSQLSDEESSPEAPSA